MTAYGQIFPSANFHCMYSHLVCATSYPVLIIIVDGGYIRKLQCNTANLKITYMHTHESAKLTEQPMVQSSIIHTHTHAKLS